MATNKNLKFRVDIVSGYANGNPNAQYYMDDAPKLVIDAPTYQKAKTIADEKAKQYLTQYNSQIAKKGKKYFKDNERANVKTYVTIPNDYIADWIKYADDLNEATLFLNDFVKMAFPSYGKNKDFTKLFGVTEGRNSILGFQQIFSSFLPYAIKDGLTVSELKDYWDAVLQRGALDYWNGFDIKPRLPRQEAIELYDKIEKKLFTAYDKIRNKLSEDTQYRFDGMHNYLPHTIRLSKLKQVQQNEYKRRQNVAFEDGGMIGGFEYTIGGL